MSDWKVIEGDCLAVMPTLAAGSVDAIIVDCPYGTTNCRWDTVIPFAPMWEAVKRVSKPKAAIVMFASQPFTSALVMSNPAWFRFADVWDKKQVTGHLNAKKCPLRVHEDVCIFSGATLGNFTYNPQMRTGRYSNKGGPGRATDVYGSFRVVQRFDDQYYPTSLLSIPKEGGRYHRFHPNEKPLSLMEYLIRTYTNEGETVLDFCAGSGSTGVACLNTGRSFIGIEQSADYCDIARRRLADAAQQPRLELMA